MTRPSLPPTPQPSTDIVGKSSVDAPRLEHGFNLPPAALSSRSSALSSPISSESASDSSYHPPSPTSPIAKSKPSQVRKRLNSGAQNHATKQDGYSLPPPPTRSRKIIQMKPKDTQEQHQTQNRKNSTGTHATGTKRKQPGSNSAAGRKIARKTAHSLIERRRRSKMNDEFGVLKDMIPACKGQEMHKLAILQASVDYMRYLEQCVHDLKNGHKSQSEAPLPRAVGHSHQLVRDHTDDDEDADDKEMKDVVSCPAKEDGVSKHTWQSINPSPAIKPNLSTLQSPVIKPNSSGHWSTNTSPAIQPADSRHYSLASTSVHSALASPSIQPSPAFGALTPSAVQFSNPFSTLPPSSTSTVAPGTPQEAKPFTLTSPVLGPQDQEASQALLMLNTDRRNWRGARGMSVKDLLSG